jgi:hypothetical protein
MGKKRKKNVEKKKKKEFAPRISVIFPELCEITIEMASGRVYRDKLVIYQSKVNVNMNDISIKTDVCCELKIGKVQNGFLTLLPRNNVFINR